MKIINLKQQSRPQYYDAEIQNDGCIVLHKAKKIFLEGKRYFINKYEEISPNLYKAVLYRPDYAKTRYNYENIDFYTIFKIERTKPKEIEIIYADGGVSTLSFIEPQECLKEFLELRKINDLERGSSCAG